MEDESCKEVFELISELENFIETSRKVPFTNSQVMVDKGEILKKTMAIRDRQPTANQSALKILSERDQTIQSAKRESDNILAEANARARALKMKSEQSAELVQHEAEEKAHYMLDDAQRRVEDMLARAERDAENMVSETAIVLAAEKRAAETMNEAREKADDEVAKAIEFCEQRLRDAEDAAAIAADKLRDARMQLDQD